jgi:hypothetical protein
VNDQLARQIPSVTDGLFVQLCFIVLAVDKPGMTIEALRESQAVHLARRQLAMIRRFTEDAIADVPDVPAEQKRFLAFLYKELDRAAAQRAGMLMEAGRENG